MADELRWVFSSAVVDRAPSVVRFALFFHLAPPSRPRTGRCSVSQFLPEMAMGRGCNPSGALRLALKTRRLYEWSKEADLRKAFRRAAVLRTMSQAYASAGIAWSHRDVDTRQSFTQSCEMFEQADDLIDRARLLSDAYDAPTMRSGGTA